MNFGDIVKEVRFDSQLKPEALLDQLKRHADVYKFFTLSPTH